VLRSAKHQLSSALKPRGRPKGRELRPLFRLVPFFKPYLGRVVIALMALMLAAAATLAMPVAVRWLIDQGFSSADPRLVNRYFLGMLGIVALLAAASGLRFYFVNWLSERVVADVRRRVFSHLLELSAYFYEQTRTGEVVSRLTADTTQIKTTFGFAASVALRNMIMMSGAVVMMVLTSPRLSGFTLLAIPLIIVPIIVFGQRVRKLSRLAQDTLAGSAATAQESLSSIFIVQAFGQEERVSGRFGGETEIAFRAARRRSKARAFLTSSIIFLSLGSVVAILWLGAKDVLAGEITAGTLGQFVLYAAIAASAVGELSQVWGEIQLAAGAAERLSEILDNEPQIRTPLHPVALPERRASSIGFENVSFRYPSRPDHAALKGLSFQVAAGETLAIVGPSGAGKSTIFNLLLRSYDAEAGRIAVDGVDIALADPKSVRRRFAVVPQESVMFSASVYDNISFGRPEASEGEVLAAAQAAHVSEFADALPQGLYTQVGERGVTLSGGQRQRIALARAILRNAPVLLLDEATSSLDSESERAVQEAVEKLKSGRTTLIIAHRLATVRNADRILVLEKGGLVAEGSHEELLKRGGLYGRLAKLQFNAA
jgi:ATP-binding cassette subfamily B protein